jgi:hypothetical protein
MNMDGTGRGFPPGEIRVSDADRDRAVSELGEAFRVGRLTADEFDERAGQALAARTGRDLSALLADLPPTGPPAAGTKPAAGTEPAVRQGPGVRGPVVAGLPPRTVAVRTVMGASAAFATIAFASSAANAVRRGPSLAQQEALRALAARQGWPTPPPVHNAVFSWVPVLVPAALGVLLVLLIVVLHVSRADRARA